MRFHSGFGDPIAASITLFLLPCSMSAGTSRSRGLRSELGVRAATLWATGGGNPWRWR